MESKQWNKIKWAAGIAGGALVLLAGYAKSKQKGETLYKFSVFPGENESQKTEIVAYIKGILEGYGWAFTMKDTYETIDFFVLRAKEEALYGLGRTVENRWPGVNFFCTKEEKSYRRI